MTIDIKRHWVCPEHDGEIGGCEGEACCCRDRHYTRKGFRARLRGRLAGASAG